MTNSSSAMVSSSSRRARARGRRRRPSKSIASGCEPVVIASPAFAFGFAWPDCSAGGGELVAHHVAARLLERAVERRLEQVRVGEVVDVGAADDPQADALLAPAVHLAGVVEGERRRRAP